MDHPPAALHQMDASWRPNIPSDGSLLCPISHNGHIMMICLPSMVYILRSKSSIMGSHPWSISSITDLSDPYDLTLVFWSCEPSLGLSSPSWSNIIIHQYGWSWYCYCCCCVVVLLCCCCVVVVVVDAVFLLLVCLCLCCVVAVVVTHRSWTTCGWTTALPFSYMSLC